MCYVSHVHYAKYSCSRLHTERPCWSCNKCAKKVKQGKGGLINFLPLKREGVLERVAYLRRERGALIEDLQ